MLFKREDIVNFSVKIGCKRELHTKGMVVSVLGDVVCLATLSGDYQDQIYYMNGIKSPSEVYYCGAYGNGALSRIDSGNRETQKNSAVTLVNGKTNFIYFFEKIHEDSDFFYFHGRYKYLRYEIVKSYNPEHKEEILFHLLFVDKPF
ncbi:MAG: hypothetical protein A2Y45_06200 [Tenericutes bacterium GWC2_34_14]|nr:MAG: hypothetical protein A2Z84_00455 [Tenericutes bacterium GWA2_35_7]OHE28546.1 MAG: hypothetical protein A2Y45_06200 [Tenericutes bacterium GWC2_34_14]OHE33546.1 MAG: hypothetical protein A2012_03610 [Tenericutes bacterium GWE2_34_108]OHE36831.1 MAG: hypothetical protein A2Y46_09410 [Tenericutes bacterium GWF1_35_14]OHE38089.1 MAG: hypothetical protein A2Y44_09255 [Tenericutes bacterium GWF2_35_184]OHE43394.1 MAG: hypothetical protein A2221_06480 [Tenericutes bacterium RIFOXYA2_FULL_36_3